jgi:hypothetical protein
MLALAALVCLRAGVAAQSAEQAQPTTIADSANRLAQELRFPRVDPEMLANMPVFRAKVTIDIWALPPPWHLTETPGPRNPRFNGYHQEHLMLTTPEELRTSTFYPIGIGVDPAVIVNAAKRGWRDWQTARIRQRITEELEALERARAAAAADNGAEAIVPQP